MNINALAKVDLNLLLALHVLLQEKSVSGAAKRLNVTQPAMSKTLARLRDAFGDPLFVRSRRGIQPTPRAEAVARDLGAVLATIETLLDAGEFVPSAFRGDIQLAISEYVGLSLLPPLSARLQSVAPKMQLRTITRVENQLEELASGGLDFAIQLTRKHYPAEFRTHSLGGSPLAVFVRRGHPIIGTPLSSSLLEQYPTINLYVSDRAALEGLPDINLDAFSSHNGLLETSHLLTALEVLRETNYTLICPAYLARNDGATRDIVAIPLPPTEAQSVDYTLVAHERTAHSPIHQWLWSEIIDTVRNMRLRTVHRG